MFGYFDIASLALSSNTVIRYVDLLWMDITSKLEVDWFAARKHVVLVGQGEKGYATIVDAFDGGSYWNINYANVYNDSLKFTDLAITSSYVVATSILNEMMGCGRGILWWFDKPSSAGGSFLLSTMYVPWTMSLSLFGSYLVRACYDDYFVTANSYWKNVYGTATYSITHYNSLYYVKNMI